MNFGLDWDVPGATRRDKRIADLFQIETRQFLVKQIQVGKTGSFTIVLNGEYTLDGLPDDSMMESTGGYFSLHPKNLTSPILAKGLNTPILWLEAFPIVQQSEKDAAMAAYKRFALKSTDPQLRNLIVGGESTIIYSMPSSALPGFDARGESRVVKGSRLPAWVVFQKASGQRSG